MVVFFVCFETRSFDKNVRQTSVSECMSDSLDVAEDVAAV